MELTSEFPRWMVFFVLAGLSGCGANGTGTAEPQPVVEQSKTATATDVAVTGGSTGEAFTPPQLLTDEQIAAGWIALFDGHSLFGWEPNQESTNWSVAGGVITADGGDPGMLMTTVEWADFELTCDVRLEAEGNSGIFLRSTFNPQDPAVDCYELNVCDTHATFPSGSLVARKKLEPVPNVEGEWHTFHTRLEGPRVTVQLDGNLVLDYTDDSKAPLRKGHIGLQFNGGKVEFRNVFLKPLGMESVFNGEDLTGWREVPGSKSEFKVDDGTIHVTKGAGFLETADTWDDFVLRVDARTNGRHLNSGVFFRALRGTEEAPSHGYEMQIHNGYKDGDPTQPVDAGTGAIFRRQAARRVMSQDGEWLTAVLVAQGPHFATWVNGYQVVDWTDTREPDENPRRGRRLQAGHISLQGHDPTTDLQFKNLQVGKLPK